MSTSQRLTPQDDQLRPRINYESLSQICQLRNGKSHYDTDHERFMKEYPNIFLSKQSHRPSEERWRTLSAVQSRKSVQSTPVSQLRRNRTRSLQEKDSLLINRLKEIVNIVQTPPPLRSFATVKELGTLISYFPALFEDTSLSPLVIEAIAARAIIERIRERNGVALPHDGGVYLVLQGLVRELNQEESADGHSHTYKTRLLVPGDVFGVLKEPVYPMKHSYPIYMGYNKTLVMRVTLSDYHRAIETVEEGQLQRNLKEIFNSVVLNKFPQSIQQKLAKVIQWKTVGPSTKMFHWIIIIVNSLFIPPAHHDKQEILQEGKLIKAVSIVKKGHCKVYKRVPNYNSSVCIGEITECGCIGECYFDNPDALSTYTVITTANTVIGQIHAKDIDENQLSELTDVFCQRFIVVMHEKCIGIDVLTARGPLKKVYSVVIPSEEQLKALLAEKIISKHWETTRRTIVSGVYSRK